ncbi:OmpA family protein [Spirosoma sordidisoli]|uniref:OmpA family protein n=1 Tax=Spirosoma sordidisoli TaxID=2502893 RepID=A0A4Q2UR79_9BACT|nr:OmpA family protein [Spirosoma sordidisoli]RYC72054.1 OmpA family protein [Spirosoma sordidisoli]
MNRYLLALLVGLVWAPDLLAQVQYTTPKPRVDDVNDTDVSIQRVELTDQYTILYMKFQAAGSRRQIPDRTISSTIGFQPSSRLYVNQGERSYKFVRAENIPLETRRRVTPGESVDFVAYFERIDPGYTVFDLFECKDSYGYVCFNFWGVHIINPPRPPKDTYAKRSPRPQGAVTPAPRPRSLPQSAPETKTPAPVTPAPVPASISITGITRNAKSRKPITATVSYQLISGAEAAGDDPADSVLSGSLTGKYQIPVDRRGVYAVTASAPGYFSQSDTLATNRINLTRDFDLVPIEAGATVTLRNIYFNVSKYDLKPESFPELNRLVTVMQDNPTMQIRLEGHTDTVGDFDANVELSRNRVNAVKRYLVSKGIAAGRIETVGYGPSRPINTNRSLKERPENRRVEMVVVTV